MAITDKTRKRQRADEENRRLEAERKRSEGKSSFLKKAGIVTVVLLVAGGIYLSSKQPSLKQRVSISPKPSVSESQRTMQEVQRPMTTVPPATEGDSAEEKVPSGMVFVKGECFQMGDTFGDGDSDEKPVHEVCVDDFYMDKYEVTQKEYRQIMRDNPSRFKGEHNPVETVSWHDAKEYCDNIGKQLPTEAEWEYAARSGGKREKWSGTSSESELGEYAWYYRNSGKKTHPVGQKSPNGLGLYDMSGNVWEWVADRYDSDYYKSSPKYNPKGPNNGKFRVRRGGSWYGGALFNRSRRVRSTFRIGKWSDGTDGNLGFRCSRTL